MLLPHGTIIALIDGKSFELFRNAGVEGSPDLHMVAAPRLDAHNHSGASHHSSAGNKSDSLVAEDAHAIAVVHWLNQEALAHRIPHIVIIAAPRTLGELRKHYHKTLQQALIGEVAKDLVGRNAQEVLAALHAGS
ncbi:MAG: host attachment protein [Sphingomonadales bacterium]|nr:host attachment protein [Sphingomonadales bacterium]